MTNPIPSNSKIRLLFSEGSSTNAREMIAALGPLGYTIDLCDPNPLACLGRFSRYVRRVYRCPNSSDDPIGYLQFILHQLKSRRYDVLFPANEQAYLFAWAREPLAPLAGLAVADFAAFNRVQTKSAFTRLLDELGLHHPETRIIQTWPEVEQAARDFELPFYLKTSFGTASTGVWKIESEERLREVHSRLDAQQQLNGENEFLVQAAAAGFFEQSHAIFDQGRLIALRCTRRLVEGAQGGPVLKIGVDRPAVRRDFETLGRELSWHGSLSIDYFWDEHSGQPSYIDANPRLCEPMNAVFNGVNFADLQVRLSLGEKLQPIPDGTRSAKSHNLLQAMLGAAGWRGSRGDVLAEVWRVARHQGIYRDSREGMTPVGEDFPSILPLAVIMTALLINPGAQQRLALGTISNYSLGDAIPRLASMSPEIPDQKLGKQLSIDK